MVSAVLGLALCVVSASLESLVTKCCMREAGIDYLCSVPFLIIIY